MCVWLQIILPHLVVWKPILMAPSEPPPMVSPTTTISVDGDHEKRFSVEEDPLPTASAPIASSAVALAPNDLSGVHGNGSKTPPKGHSGFTAPLDIPKWRFMAIFASLMISIFLFALGRCGPSIFPSTNLLISMQTNLSSLPPFPKLLPNSILLRNCHGSPLDSCKRSTFYSAFKLDASKPYALIIQPALFTIDEHLPF